MAAHALAELGEAGPTASDERRRSVFATVGSMLPFDRLVRAVDAWAADRPGVDTFIQVGEGRYEPRHARWARVLNPADFAERLSACDLFVAHAGIGSMVQALQATKQVVILPRHASLGEHTTEHQLHTVARFRDTAGLVVADDVDALGRAMDVLLETPLATDAGLSAFGPRELTARVRSFLTDP